MAKDLSWARTILLTVTARSRVNCPSASPVRGPGRSLRRRSRSSSRTWPPISPSRIRATDKRTKRVLRRLADFATSEGLPLERQVILDPDTVERFVEIALSGERSAATYRSLLRRVGPLLTSSAPWEPLPVSLQRRALVVPYSEVEVRILCEDAALQPSESRRRPLSGFSLWGSVPASTGAGWPRCAPPMS